MNIQIFEFLVYETVLWKILKCLNDISTLGLFHLYNTCLLLANQPPPTNTWNSNCNWFYYVKMGFTFEQLWIVSNFIPVKSVDTEIRKHHHILPYKIVQWSQRLQLTLQHKTLDNTGLKVPAGYIICKHLTSFIHS